LWQNTILNDLNIVTYYNYIMFSQIKSLANKIIFNKPQPMHLGRWKLNQPNKINLKIDYSNEDHCGTCSEYIIKKRSSSPTNKKN